MARCRFSRDGRRKAHVLRHLGDVREQQIRSRIHTQRIEVMLTDPAGVHTDRIREDRLLADLEDEVVRRAPIVGVVVVA